MSDVNQARHTVQKPRTLESRFPIFNYLWWDSKSKSPLGLKPGAVTASTSTFNNAAPTTRQMDFLLNDVGRPLYIVVLK